MEVREQGTIGAAGEVERPRDPAWDSRQSRTTEVVLLTRDSAADLRRSLPALREAVLRAGAELLFVDLGSVDGTREYVASQAQGARGIWLESDDRASEALSAATAASRAEVLVFVEPTVEPTSPDAVAHLIAQVKAHPGARALAPGTAGVLAVRRAHLQELLERDPADPLGELRREARTVGGPAADAWQVLNGEPGHDRCPAGALRTTRPMVLHVVECFAAGTERHVRDLVRHMPEFEHVLAIPSSHHGQSTSAAAEAALSLGARVERVEMGRSRAPHRHVRALMELRRLIARLQPEVVHGHSSIGGAMARIATLAMSLPVVYTPHALSRSRWALVVERLLRRRAERLIAVSEGEREFMLAHRLADEGHAVVIPNGIELTPPPPLDEPLRGQLGITAQTPLIGCVGRLSWQKAPEVFVSACSILADRLPEAHFVLIGSGPLKGLVEKAIRVTGIEDRFHLVPELPGAAAALGELDVYALPSRFEGGPYTPMEAMRAGTPVVVTGVPGNRDLVEHWKSGLVVPPDEPYALATAILTVLRDPALRERLIEGGRRSLDRFEVRSMAAATAEVYRELIPSRPQGAGADARGDGEALDVCARG